MGAVRLRCVCMEKHWSTQAQLSIGRIPKKLFQTEVTEFSSAKEKSMTSTVGGFECVPLWSFVSVLYTHIVTFGGFFLH